ncbi:hypothetical protein C8R43DRAFT_1128229 [Mycena crocata]|nr:hypothetical protein C8R43DRAFT_1128229 [Mycena crocata]
MDIVSEIGIGSESEHFTSFYVGPLSSTLPSTKRPHHSFAPETLARIFSQLSYQSLLAVLAVSKQWSNIVTNDPALSVRCSSDLARSMLNQLHPALNQASYMLGDELAEVTFYIDGDNHPKLVDLAIANDLISIHAVKTFTIPTFRIGTTAVQIFLLSFLPPALLLSKSKTARASRCIHVFAEMEKETNRKIRTARHGMATQRDLLGNHT